MKRFGWTFVSVLSLSLLFAGCGKQEAQPAAIVEGVDECDLCHMSVFDDHNATQLVLAGGKTLKFDDIGCMHRWMEENGSGQVQAQFVRDYHSKEWLHFQEATFAYDPSYETPMGYGIYSFKERSEAEAFVQQQGAGTVMSAQDLANHSWTSTMKKHHDAHDGDSHAGHDHGAEATHDSTGAHEAAEQQHAH